MNYQPRIDTLLSGRAPEKFPSGNMPLSATPVEMDSDEDELSVQWRRENQWAKQLRRIEYSEDEEDESYAGGSSNFASRVGGSYEDTVAVDEKDPYCDVPAAQPFNGCHNEISQSPDQISASRSCNIRHAVGSDVEASSRVNAATNMSGQFIRGHGIWNSMIAYDACTRLCLHSWAKGCMEAPIFLENECELLRDSFGLQHILLQSEEELLAKRSVELVSEGAAPKPRKTLGKMEVQVRKVRMYMDMPSGCNFPSLKMPIVKMKSLRCRMSDLQLTLSSGWESLRKVCVLPRLPANRSLSRHTSAYIHASAQYIKQVCGVLKIGAITLHHRSSYKVVQETYSCRLTLKSSTEVDGVQMQSGSGETHVFFPDCLGDNLFVEVYDSKGKLCGRALVQVESIADDPSNKLRWWPIYCEPERTLVGRIQLHVDYSCTTYENNHIEVLGGALTEGFWMPISVSKDYTEEQFRRRTETVAYDTVLGVALKYQNFHQRTLLLHGSWKWLLTEFASYYGVSDAYTKLRYLSYVMDVATPTEDCLMLVHDFLLPVILKSRSKNPLSQQENRILGKIEEQTVKILALVFENYKSLDESSPTGLLENFRPANGSPAPVLMPAVKLYTLLHDIISPEAQLKLYGYFQVAAKKRSRRHLLETDEYVTNSEGILMDDVNLSNAYQKIKTLCINLRNEIYTDIEIYNQHVLPSFIDLPSISASIYSVELYGRLRAFLVSCPPPRPCPPVSDVVTATADFAKDLVSWNICPVKGGVDAKDLFHLYIILWIQDMRLALLQSCKIKKVKWSGVQTQQLTSPFVDEIYGQLKDTLNEYEIIIRRWPEYTFVLENAIADIEKGVIQTLEKQYADILIPLKDRVMPKKFGLNSVQKLAKLHSISLYTVPDELGTLLNTMKRLLDVLRPKIEIQLKSLSSCTPIGENTVPGESLSEVTVMLRAKFKTHLQTVVAKLAENTRAHSATKLKKIIQDSKDDMMESDIHIRVQPLKDQIIQTINHLHRVFEALVFILICRGYWDWMGQDVLSFLKNQKENRSSYRGARVTVSIIDETIASQIHQLLGNALEEKDLDPPNSIMELRSILFQDAPSVADSRFYY